MTQLRTVRVKEQELDFSYKVYVNQDGNFTTTLPPDIVELLSQAGIDLTTNRSGTPGFFFSTTYQGLVKAIKEVIQEYHSKELIEDKIVIRYVIQTTCTYCLDVDRNIVPNGQKYWTKTDEYRWKEGVITQSAASPHPYGFLVYARASKKQINKYKSGKVKSEYYRLGEEELERGTYLHWLNSFAAMTSPHGAAELKEIDYTENVAKFFVDLITSICTLNEKIKEFLEPDKILQIIENKQKLLG